VPLTPVSLVHQYLLRSAERCPSKEALIHAGRRVTYAELLARARSLSGWLVERHINVGDRVGILTDDARDYVTAYFGVLMAGGVVVSLNTQTSSRVLASQLGRCQASILLTHQKFVKYLEADDSIPSVGTIAVAGGCPEGLPSARWVDLDRVLDTDRGEACRDGERPPVSPSSLAQIIFTSGTTAEPHGVMLRHSNLVANTEAIVQYLRLTERDRLMVVLPFSYSYGNSLLLTHVAVGGSLVVNQTFLYPNTVLEQMIAERATGFSGVPSTYAILLNRSAIRQYQFPDLRYLTQAGGPMAAKLGHDLKQIIPNVDVFVMYGQTEASARLSYLDPGDLVRKAGSVGKAIPGVTLRVLDAEGRPVGIGEVGEIVATGDNVMAGYWGEPEQTARVLRDGHLWTGDLAKMDEDGYVYIVGRQSDMIKSGAHRISPREIEAVLLEYPAVHEAAVVGVPDEILGETIKACVVVKDGVRCDRQDVLVHCHRHLPPYMAPHHVEFLAELPKTASGKIRVVALRERVSPERVGMVLVQQFLEQSAQRSPDKVALITDAGRFAYREIDAMANAVAHALVADGLVKGDRVAVFLDNSLEAVVGLFGILKAGGVFVVVNPTVKGGKLAYILNNCGAAAALSSWQQHAVLAEACPEVPSLRRVYLAGDPPVHARHVGVPTASLTEMLRDGRATPPPSRSIDLDLAALIYTSGTAGTPKGVMMAHTNMVAVANSVTQFLANTADDIILNTLPMSFDYGLYQILMGFKVGGTVILDNAFAYPARTIERMVKERVTGFPIVPTISSILLQMDGIKRHRFEHLRYITNTAAFLPVEHIVKLRKLFPSTKLYSMYGLTECKRVSYLPPEELDRRPTSVGKSIPNTEVFIVDPKGRPVGPGVTGELVVRGSHVMRGYWNDPKETAKKLKPGRNPGESVLYTGDLFRTDDEGFLYFVARKDDIIKTRGEKVSPKEVEAILYGLEEIAEAAVVGVPDPVLGEAIKAVVALKGGATLTAHRVLRHCSKHLEDFMVPKYVEFRDSLPRTSRGKIDKHRLTVEGGDS